MADAVEKLPIVEEMVTRCPHCGGERSLVYGTERGLGGVMRWRKCRRCEGRFRSWAAAEGESEE